MNMRKAPVIATFSLYLLVLLGLFLIPADYLLAVYSMTGITGDGLFHFVSFLILALFLHSILRMYYIHRQLSWIITITIILALLIEALQYLLPTRDASMIDLILHVTCSLTYVTIAWIDRICLKGQL